MLYFFAGVFFSNLLNVEVWIYFPLALAAILDALSVTISCLSSAVHARLLCLQLFLQKKWERKKYRAYQNWLSSMRFRHADFYFLIETSDLIISMLDTWHSFKKVDKKERFRNTPFGNGAAFFFMNFVCCFFFVCRCQNQFCFRICLCTSWTFSCAPLILMCSCYPAWCAPISRKQRKIIVDSCQPFVHNFRIRIRRHTICLCWAKQIKKSKFYHWHFYTIILLVNKNWLQTAACKQTFNSSRKYNADCLSKKEKTWIIIIVAGCRRRHYNHFTLLWLRLKGASLHLIIV